MTYQGRSRLSENLTESQKQAVWHKDGALLVLAGPGSGKTRVITHRIAALIHQGVKPYNICAITFTNKAAEEMRSRVEAIGNTSGVYVSTFHSLCVRLLRQFADAAKIASNFSIYDSSEQKVCVKEAVKRAELDSKNFPPAKMLDAISRLKNNLQTAEAFEQDGIGDYFSKCLAKVYRNYQHNLEKNNALDFDDLLFKTAYLLKDNFDIRNQVSQRFKYLLVDEYQDTNHAQYQIARAMAMEHGNICVTGDPDQSIYGWRGADIGNILAFEHDWPQATVIKLQENFRSVPEVLTPADKLISCNKGRKQKKLLPVLAGGGKVDVSCLEDEYKEAECVAEFVKYHLDKGCSAGEIAVFYRVNSMSRAVEEAMVKNGIPYQVVRGVEFYNRKEIKDLLAYLKLVVNDSDDNALLRIINTPARGIGKTTINKLLPFAAANNISLYSACCSCQNVPLLAAGTKEKIKKFVLLIETFKKQQNLSVAELMDNIFRQSGMFADLQAESAKDDYSKAAPLDNIAELIKSAERFDLQQHSDEDTALLDFLQSIALFSDTDNYDSRSEKVSLMTLHCAKGLEFDNVAIIGLEEKILPHERSMDSRTEIEEERRLFFVGLTRARKNLCITLSRYRTVHGQFSRTIDSQFLYEADLQYQTVEQQSSFEEFRPKSEGQLHYEKEPFCDSYEKKKNPYSIGQLVSHKKFGFGRIKEFHNLGENSIVVVQFKAGYVKPLMLKYANLSIIE